MTDPLDNDKDKKSIELLLTQLQERAKELTCLYRVDEALAAKDVAIEEIWAYVIEALPPGWQYPEVCVARITIEGRTVQSEGFAETAWFQKADIRVGESKVGELAVYYTKEMPQWDEGPFLKEEAKLIQTIADRIGNRILHLKTRDIVEQWEQTRGKHPAQSKGEWRVVLQMVQQTDRNLFINVSRKMLNHLCWSGVEEADQLMKSFTADPQTLEAEMLEDPNQPFHRHQAGFSVEMCNAVFAIAAAQLADSEILRLLQKWIQEDKLSFLVQVVNRNLSLSEVADAIRRYQYLAETEPEIHSPNKRGIEVSLIRRFLSDQLQYISVAKNFIEISDFYHLLNSVVFTGGSHGKLGGKSAGIYLAAQILKKKAADNDLLARIKTPRTFYVTSDVLLHFMHYNNFDEVVEQKYKPMNQVRFEYPHVVQTFKNARFPADIVNGLSAALDVFGEQPIIVRSSSLLEDRIGASFSGKYKSLFLANQGSKQKRLEELMDAIAEVYASTFGPDPIEYRAERELLDFGEEMGIMIQEVVGTRVGKYYLPSFAGVAFSRNEFRWSPRIRREDGLIRMVPGMGTRAVDRLSDDYPILAAPGQPNLRVNATPDETVRYSPTKLDVIDLETNSFETISFREFVRETGGKLPAIEQMISIHKDANLSPPTILTDLEQESDHIIVTFDGLMSRTPLLKQTKAILDILQETLGVPVDIEFAHDGKDYYLLQCRAQSYSETSAPSPIPQRIPKEDVIFTATRYVSNGSTPGITHIVYVDPLAYSNLPDRNSMIAVGRAVSHLNKVLPKRQFVLMGPGRWGSRGDIKLGVNATYSDINNTAALIEIARRKGNYVPDLSFGTHFFQDLVEADIKYLPLYPDEDGIVFNDAFFVLSENMLAQIAPEFAALKTTVRLIDVPKNTGGKVLQILMNADQGKAVGILTEKTYAAQVEPADPEPESISDEHPWQWRQRMVERIAREIDAERFGIANLYVFGSTKNATAGPASDIDLLVHFRGTPNQLTLLQNWFDGWSLCLSEANYMQTGYRTDGLLDIHIVTDDDIARKDSWAAKINAVTDAARPLELDRSTNP